MPVTASPTAPAPAPTTAAPTPTATATAPAGWTLGYARRDLTPGARNPAVTQGTIGQTICVVGWTDTVRPSSTYTNTLKVSGIRAYGYADTSLTSYKEDHVLPLEVGGAPSDPANLFPQPTAAASMKDRDEDAGHLAVCGDPVRHIPATKTLAQAQADIVAKWVR